MHFSTANTSGCSHAIIDSMLSAHAIILNTADTAGEMCPFGSDVMSISVLPASQTARGVFFLFPASHDGEHYFDSSVDIAPRSHCWHACGSENKAAVMAVAAAAQQGARLMLPDSPCPSDVTAGVPDVGEGEPLI